MLTMLSHTYMLLAATYMGMCWRDSRPIEPKATRLHVHRYVCRLHVGMPFAHDRDASEEELVVATVGRWPRRRTFLVYAMVWRRPTSDVLRASRCDDALHALGFKHFNHGAMSPSSCEASAMQSYVLLWKQLVSIYVNNWDGALHKDSLDTCMKPTSYRTHPNPRSSHLFLVGQPTPLVCALGALPCYGVGALSTWSWCPTVRGASRVLVARAATVAAP